MRSEFWNHPPPLEPKRSLSAIWLQTTNYPSTPLHYYTNTRKYFKFCDDRFEFWNHPPFGAKEITLDYSHYSITPLHHYTIIQLHEYTKTPLHHYSTPPSHEYTNTRIHEYTIIQLHHSTITPIYNYIKNNSQNLWFYLRNSPTL